MKKLIFAMAVAAATATGAFAELKIGTVDLMLLVRNHPSYESNKTLLTATDKDFPGYTWVIDGTPRGLAIIVR